MRHPSIPSILSYTSTLRYPSCRCPPTFAQRGSLPQNLPANTRWAPIPESPRCTYTSTTSQSSLAIDSDSNFCYRIGTSFSAKGRRFNPKEDVFTFDSEVPITSDNDIYTGQPRSGQDAFFVSKAGNRNSAAFGVADGVGGWSDSGIDSAHFSHGMCKWMAKLANAGPTSEKPLAPRDLLQNAYTQLVEEGKVIGGGSTACIAVGSSNGTLQVSNLGDSGYILLRPNAIHHFSNPQTHAFNTPYQISLVPPKILALSRLFGGQHLSDSPSDSDTTTHTVRHGDVLIFATDGVWDNLSQLELLKIVSRQMTESRAWVTISDAGITVSDSLARLTRLGNEGVKALQTVLATSIVSEAKAASLDRGRDGPFAKEVQRNYPGENYTGGKVDDICVVVAVVVKTGNEERQSKL